ncbi:uncharacterized protein LOC62_03G004171 [Vanrija pseudolonga]|uniref:Uncharacterized protein n=1 Tax=Vanrija pseudolonga TaxID=143232 RepID=A0AAF0Y624_9TREE|nr:hypothetical protein LOC62_03G004171 [Vanrija pseudolonga]
MTDSIPQLIKPATDSHPPVSSGPHLLNALNLIMAEDDWTPGSRYSYRYSHLRGRPGRVISITSSLPMADDSDVDPDGFDAFSDTESCVAIRDSFFRAIQYVPPTDNVHLTPPLNIRKRSQASLVHRSLSRRSSFPQSPITPPLKAFAPLPMVESPPRRSMSVAHRPLPPLPPLTHGASHAKHSHSRSEPPVPRPFRPLPPIPTAKKPASPVVAKPPAPPASSPPFAPEPSSAPAPPPVVPQTVFTPPPRPRPQNPPPIVQREISDEDMVTDTSDDDLDEFFGPRKPKKAAGELAPGGHPRKAAYVLGIVEEEEPTDAPSKAITVLGTRERAAHISPSPDRSSPKKHKREGRDYKALRFGDATKHQRKPSKPLEISAPIPLRGYYFDEQFGGLRPAPKAEAERREANAGIDLSSVFVSDPVKPSSSSVKIVPSEKWELPGESSSSSVKGPFTDTWDELFYQPRHGPGPSALKFEDVASRPRNEPWSSWAAEFKPPPRIGSIFSESFKLNLKNLNQSSSTLSPTPPESPARATAATLSGTSDEDEARPKRPKTRPPALHLDESAFRGRAATPVVAHEMSPTDTSSSRIPRLPPTDRIQFATPNTSFEDLDLPLATAEPLLRPMSPPVSSPPESGPSRKAVLRAAFQRSMAAIGGASPPSDAAVSASSTPSSTASVKTPAGTPAAVTPATAGLKSPIRLVSNPRGLPVYGTSAVAELRENEGVSWFEPETPGPSPVNTVATSWLRRVAKPLVR